MKWFKNKNKATKIQQENQAEQKVLHPAGIRFSNYWNSQGITTFHKTKFSFGSSAMLLLIFLILGNIFGDITQLAYRAYTGNSLREYMKLSHLQSIQDIMTKLLPLIILVWLYNNRNHFKAVIVKFCQWRLRHKHFKCVKLAQAFQINKYKESQHWVWFQPYKRIIKAFWNDMRKRYKTILILFVILQLCNIIIKTVLVPIAGVTVATPVVTTVFQLAKSDWLILPAWVLIVPPAEELIYRVFMPNVIAGCFDGLFKKHQFWKTKYVGASIFSALIFAQNHLISGQNWGIALSIFAFALIQQMIYCKSKSITLPIILHSISNLLKVIVEL